MKSVLTSVAAAAVAVAFTAGAVATLSPASQAEESVDTRVIRHSPPAFTEVDADGDGMVTETEFLAFIEARHAAAGPPSADGTDPFARADADGDGFLSREEFEAAPRRIMHHRFRMGDPKKLFARADADRDSVLSEGEFDDLLGAIHRRHSAVSHAHDTP